jgi:gluconate 2-dehydrogenase gamma chain
MSESVSRREALALIGVVPLAVAFDVTPASLERALRHVQQAQQQRAAYQPKFFTAHEWQTVRVLVNLVIPRDERSGSATEAGVPEFMDFMMRDRPAMQIPMRGGLRWLDSESVERFGRRFIALTPNRRNAILDDIAYPKRARPEMSHGVNFFNFFRDLTASGFFTSKMGMEDLQYMGNKWVTEWKGCPPTALQRLGVSYEDS